MPPNMIIWLLDIMVVHHTDSRSVVFVLTIWLQAASYLAFNDSLDISFGESWNTEDVLLRE